VALCGGQALEFLHPPAGPAGAACEGGSGWRAGAIIEIDAYGWRSHRPPSPRRCSMLGDTTATQPRAMDRWGGVVAAVGCRGLTVLGCPAGRHSPVNSIGSAVLRGVPRLALRLPIHALGVDWRWEPAPRLPGYRAGAQDQRGATSGPIRFAGWGRAVPLAKGVRPGRAHPSSPRDANTFAHEGDAMGGAPDAWPCRRFRQLYLVNV
jgi:hypothetical protein